MESQTARILTDLKSGKTITPIEALNNHGCFRLAARIHRLRERGWPIKTELVEDDGKTFAKYYLIPDRNTWPC